MRPTGPLRVLIASFSVLGACGPTTFQPAWDTPPPNVLLLSVDTLRADHLGHYGYSRPTSPALDRLADEAVVFENAQSSSSWTLPGLATALTSHHTSTTSCWSFASRLDPSFPTLPEYLRDYGYDTASVYSHYFLSPSHGLQQGVIHFEDRLPPADMGVDDAVSSEAISDGGIRFLEAKAEAPDGLPWFLWLHYFDPHDEYVHHAGITEEFVDEGEPDPRRALYDGEIRFTDGHIGRVLDALERADFPNDTVVVFFSDHGEEFLDHGSVGHGHTLFDELTRVPLVIRAPGLAPRRVPHLVRTVDILPTILDLVSHPLPDGIAGRSLGPALRGENFAAVPALSELRLKIETQMESIQDERWKLVRRLEEGFPVHLFDLREDPDQLHDVATAHPDVVRELTRHLRTAVTRAEEAARGFDRAEELDLTPAQLEELSRLGYVGDEP